MRGTIYIICITKKDRQFLGCNIRQHDCIAKSSRKSAFVSDTVFFTGVEVLKRLRK